MIMLFLLVLLSPFTSSFEVNVNHFKYQICSYQGTPKYEESLKKIVCACFDRYTNDPNEKREILGQKVQCGYSKNRRFIVFFLALFIPFGFEYIYLERIFTFFLIFIPSVGIIALNVYFFVIKKQAIDGDNKGLIVGLVLFFLYVCFAIANLVLLSTGLIKDGNGVETFADLDYLFSALI